MKPAPFRYLAPSTLDEALGLLAEHGDEAKVLAGGQSLVPAMSFRLAQPAVLVDLRRVPDLAGIREPADGGLTIGAMTRQRAVERSAAVARRAPLVAETLPHIAHPQIRNRGTFGGSIAHADPAAELPAVVLALDARLVLRSARGERVVAATDFFTGLFETALEADEMLTEVRLPASPPRTGWAFRELSRRHGDYAMVGVAARVTAGPDGRVTDARLVYLSAGPGPVAAHQAVASLVGTTGDGAAVAACARVAAFEDLDPPADIHATVAYRRHLAEVLGRRALETAVARISRDPS